MADTFITIARGIFDKKLKEMADFRNELTKRRENDLANVSGKLREYERLVAELGKNHRKAEKILSEIRALASRAKIKRKKISHPTS